MQQLEGTAFSPSPYIRAAAVRVVARLAQAWELTEGELAELLGVQSDGVQAWQLDPEKITSATLERITLMLGIFNAINTLLPEPFAADNWIRRSNAAPFFGGRTALATMLQGGLPAMKTVRRHLNAQVWSN